MFIMYVFSYSDGMHHLFEDVDFAGMDVQECVVFMERFVEENFKTWTMLTSSTLTIIVNAKCICTWIISVVLICRSRLMKTKMKLLALMTTIHA